MFPGENAMTPLRARALRCNGICGSFPVTALLFLFACLTVYFKIYVAGAFAFVVIVSLELVLCSDLSVTALPLLLLSVSVTPCYDSYSTFIRYIWLAPVFLAALLFNLFAYGEKMRIGRTFFGQLAVMIALMLGGTGFIAREDLLSPLSLYYVLMLGIGMVFFCLLLRARFARFNIYGIFGRIAVTMYLIGLLACLIVALYTIRDNPAEPEFFARVLRNLRYSEFRASNNLSTFLMLAMPFPAWYALKQHPIHIFTCFVFYAAIIVGGSRAGVLLGAVELFLVVLFWLRYCGAVTRKIGSFIGTMVFLFFVIGVSWFVSTYPDFEFFHEGEFRVRALGIAIEEFKAHPVFGIGLFNHSLDGVYEFKTGALAWFHMYIPQILASMGLVGAAAYLFQLILRGTLIFRRRRGPVRSTLALSYIGLLLMSQLNPGEFCPLPYALMAVAVFVMLEQLDETERLARLLAPEWGEDA